MRLTSLPHLRDLHGVSQQLVEVLLELRRHLVVASLHVRNGARSQVLGWHLVSQEIADFNQNGP